MAVNLGDRVKDRISGVQGIAVARTEWLYGCVRICIQQEKATKDGKPQDTFTVDEPQCEVLKAAAVGNRPTWREESVLLPRRAAGPRPDAMIYPDAER